MSRYPINECFVVPVEPRVADTRLSLIMQYVVPGETIAPNQCDAFRTVEHAPDGYQHETVNHSLHFIDPETGAYKNSIEYLRQKFKEGYKTRYGTERAPLNSYIDEGV